MGTVNRVALRAEFDAHRESFRRLRREGKVSGESEVLVNSLLMLMELMMAVFMEKTTRKTPVNASLPPSREGKDETAARPGSRGRGPEQGHWETGHTRLVRETGVSPVTECAACGRNLVRVRCEGHEHRTLVDIVFEVREYHVDAEIKTCPRCHAENRGAFPDGLSGPLQYGHGIIAFAAHLMVAQMVPLKRVVQTMKAMTGRAIAEATLLAWLLRLHDALADWEAAAVERLLAAPALHVDETSIRIDRRNHWLHDYSAGDLTLKFCHPKRGGEAIRDIGIIPRYGGVLVHDRWASYLAWDHCDHALCGAHLLRDLEFLIDAHDPAWARRMKKLLRDAARKVRESPDKVLSPRECAALQKRYRTILTQGKKELPATPVRTGGKKRGRIAKSDAENLWEAMGRHETAVLRFARDPAVSFTNNLSERNLRMAKVKQKVSGCFRTYKYAVVWCRVSSYLLSMSYQGYNPLAAIDIALKGKAAHMLKKPE